MAADPPEDSFAALFERTGKAAPPRHAPRIGETFNAVIVQVGRDAVFVDLDGRRQGAIEANDLRAPDGSIRAVVGGLVRAKVARVDPETGIWLTPTVETAAEAGASVAIGAPEEGGIRIALGQAVACVVERIESYGLFVQIEGTRGRAGRGLLPTVELGAPRGADLRKAFPLGTKLTAKVLALGEGKLRLSLKALKDDEERSQFEGHREKTGRAPSLGTLGDLLNARRTK
jgi:small subunit ribosomal protein S1